MGQAIATFVEKRYFEDRYFNQETKLVEGEFGTVWRAVDKKADKYVIIKLLDKAFLKKQQQQQSRNDVEREIKLMKVWRHDNIVALYDTFENEKSIFIVLEYCDGGSFSDKIKEQGINLSEEDAADWVAQMAEAITALHSKCICHRDIKPENFMVSNCKIKGIKTQG